VLALRLLLHDVPEILDEVQIRRIAWHFYDLQLLVLQVLHDLLDLQ
jgi:hypothetical protein